MQTSTFVRVEPGTRFSAYVEPRVARTEEPRIILTIGADEAGPLTVSMRPADAFELGAILAVARETAAAMPVDVSVDEAVQRG